MKRVKIDSLGRIVIPKSIRDGLGLRDGYEIEISLSGECATVRRAEEYCRLCNVKIDEGREVALCRDCIDKIKKM